MRAEGSVFFTDAEFCQCCVDCFCQSGKRVLCFYSDPEDSCGSWCREETSTAEADLKWFGFDRPQRRFNLRDRVIRLFTNKFQSYMQRFFVDPASIGSRSTNFLDELLNSLANCLIQIKRDENSHYALSIANRQAAERDQVKWLLLSQYEAL